MATALPAPARSAPGVTRRRIPFDYSFLFSLSGTPNRIVNATVTVSVEGAFVASSIGYGFVPRVEPIRFGGTASDFLPPPVILSRQTGPPPSPSIDKIPFAKLLDLASRKFGEAAPSASKSGEIGPQTAAVLEAGVRVNPEIARQVVLNGTSSPIDASLLTELFEVVPPPAADVQFLYALFDEGTGRAFQQEPILSTAGLGDSKGERPFRQFAAPIPFLPRTVIRMEVTEIQIHRGQLYVSLHGYKVLGGMGTPTGLPMPSGAGPVRGRR